MASIYQRGKSSEWYVQYYVGGKKKRKKLHTDCRQIAEDLKRQIESAQLYRVKLPIPTQTLLSDIIDRYVKNLLSHGSTENNVNKIISYFRNTFGPITPCLEFKNKKLSDMKKSERSEEIERIDVLYIEQLTTAVVSEFLSDLVIETGIKPKTANHYRQYLHTLCNWAMREGGVVFPGGVSPVKAVKKRTECEMDIRFLRLHDIDEQLDVLSPNLQMQTMVALYIYAGLRRSEALWLQPEDFDWDAGNYGSIRIHNKEVDGKKWVPKTKKNRTVFINSSLRPYLDAYRHQKKEEGREQRTWFFETVSHCQYDPDNFSDDLRLANSKAKLDWTCLDFRHTFGSQLAMKGESLCKVSEMMGNSPEICKKHYTRLLPESMYDSVEFPKAPGAAKPEPPPPQEITPIAKEEDVVEQEEVFERPRLRLVVNNK